ncbi:hypothetical protein [Burkholderia gladioli]|uniref:hypothetical protein n=1 Tax=Burkholderia gladioli TaxID=28095 RepID=UPI0016403930|nr:hypothetical protein [Burkholderia gladioli]
MATIDNIEMDRARRMALAGAEIGRGALAFRTALAEFLVSEPCSDLSVQFRNGSSAVAEDFSLSTPHGVVDAVFDHALKNGHLVGRYRFFVTDRVPSSVNAAKTVMTILVNSNPMLTFDPLEPFEWPLNMGIRNTEIAMGTFILSLLFHQQAALAAY